MASPSKYQNMGVITATPVVSSSSPSATPYLEVISPATLSEGYSFEAEANGKTFQVQVPEGGVKEGQVFTVPFDITTSSYTDGGVNNNSTAPIGRWRDDLCDCFRHGICHPMLWSACFCRLIALGQVMERMKLNWCGDEGIPFLCAVRPFRVLVFCQTFVIGRMIWVYCIAFSQQSAASSSSSSAYDYQVDSSSTTGPFYNFVYASGFVIVIFFICLTAKTRRRIRDRYDIRETQCHGCEDCCCAYWCGCCTIAQMARHTTDYDVYTAKCCSETGLSPDAPDMLHPSTNIV